MKFLVISDPIDRLKPATDSGLSLLRASLERGHQSYWATSQDLFMNASKLEILASPIESCPPKSLPKLASDQVEHLAVESFDALFIRKDPPFDLNYVSLCWLLSLLEEKVVMINRPSLLVKHHEKNLPFQARALGFLEDKDIAPTWMALEPEVTKGYFNNLPHKDSAWITKPWLGYGGRGVEKWKDYDNALSSLDGLQMQVLQPYFSEVESSGDRRVIFVNGKMRGHFVRMPAAGSFVSNLSQGGSAVSRELSKRDQELIAKLESFLQASGLILAGADIMAGRISEINVTAPTGMENIADLGGPQLALEIIQLAEDQVKKK